MRQQSTSAGRRQTRALAGELAPRRKDLLMGPGEARAQRCGLQARAGLGARETGICEEALHLLAPRGGALPRAALPGMGGRTVAVDTPRPGRVIKPRPSR